MSGSSGRKFDQKKHKDLRDFKNKEIKKSLTHRARLRKNYFKILQKEGITPNEPSDEQVSDTEQPDTENHHRKPLSYAEKAAAIKQRKEEQRKQKLEQIRQKRQNIDKSNQKRETVKTKLSQKTRHGQPLMGPRINNLLDKIKKDME